jgi:molecular chaperone GrpE
VDETRITEEGAAAEAAPPPAAPPPEDAPLADAPPATEAQAEAAEAVQSDLDELQAKARERDEFLALAQRTHADFENFRKRAARDQQAAERRGVARVVRELLPALDNLERALVAAAPEDQLAEGIRLVQADLLAAMAKVGIEHYSPKGEPFDPTVHEAMAQHPVEGAASGTVVEVYQQGYRFDGEVIRPARVVVAA